MSDGITQAFDRERDERRQAADGGWSRCPHCGRRGPSRDFRGHLRWSCPVVGAARTGAPGSSPEDSQ